MLKGILKIFFILIIVFCLYFVFQAPYSKALGHASDRISSSAPGASANHRITFETTKAIPPSGKIIITPESGFFIPFGFEYIDIDIATSSISNGTFIDRGLASTSDNQYDGISVVGSTTDGSITITLNSSFGIEANTYVQIELGTNANFGGAGDSEIVNPNATTSYGINVYSYDDTDRYLERANVKVFIIEQVTMTGEITNTRSHGSPIGFLTYGTEQTVISLETNFLARCRFDTASNTLYNNMSDEFSYISTTTYINYHTKLASGFDNGETYNYFVRCEDENGVKDNMTICSYHDASSTPIFDAFGNPIVTYSCLDYLIKFTVSSVEGGEEDETGDGEDGTGDDDGDSYGGGGGGGGAGGGIGRDRGRGRGSYLPYPPPPGAPGVVLEGWAYSATDVIILQDGQEIGAALANTNASFGAFLADLVKGVYTFSLWADDSAGRRSNTYSTTFWIDDGTQTVVKDIILPPTIVADKSSVTAGEVIEVFGESVPGAKIEAWLYPQKQGDLDESEIIKIEGIISDAGYWSLFINTRGLNKGTYKIKAKTVMDPEGESEFSQVLELAVDAQPQEEGICSGADLNHDGRVNLTDFSILLYHWGTDDECADQNKDGNVDLIDFSIMMYYWTG